MFYNRRKESKDIVKYISSPEQKNQILFLVGESGVGKSGLVRNLLDNELGHQFSIRVAVSKSSIDTIENLHYLNVMYRTFCECAKKHMFDTIQTPAQQGTLNLKRIFNFGKGVLRSKVGINDGNHLYEPVEDESVLRKKEYIISVLQKNQCIIDIENIQNIDTQSLELLSDIFKYVSGTTFIFEYTIGKHHSREDFSSFYNEFLLSGIKPHVCYIDKLDFEEAKKLAPLGVHEERLKQIYDKSSGNLVNLLLANEFLNYGDNPIQFSLNQLTENEKLVVDILFLNEEPMSFEQLFHVMDQHVAPPLSQSAIKMLIDDLVAKKIISWEDREVHLLHDSIFVELENTKVSPVLYVAYSSLKTYYLEQLSTEYDEGYVEHLFSLYLKFSDEEIVDILPSIERIIGNRKYPKMIMSKLTQLRSKLTEKGTVKQRCLCEVSLMLTNICIKMGFADEAQLNLSLIYCETNPYHRALQAAIFALDGTNKDNISAINSLIESSESSREKFLIQLCMMEALMAAAPASETVAYAHTLFADSGNKIFFEYAFLLRNYAEFIDDLDECIQYYHSAMQIFEAYKRKLLCAQVYVSLSMIYAYKGQLSIAREQIERANEIGGISEGHLINNSSVLDILMGQITSNTIKQLNDALLVIEDTYERIIVLCNLLICYVETGDEKLAEQTASAVETSKFNQYQYEEFLHIIYQNLWYYYGKTRHNNKTTFYQEHLEKLVELNSIRPSTRQLIELQLSGEINDAVFYSHFPFRADFLGDWTLEISRDLERSQ